LGKRFYRERVAEMKIHQRIISSKGESILETLVAIIIIVFSFTFLAQAVVTSSKVNAFVKKENIGFTYFNVSNTNEVEISDETNDWVNKTAMGSVKLIESNILIEDPGISGNQTLFDVNTNEKNEEDPLTNVFTPGGIQFNIYSIRNYVINSTRPKYFIIEKAE